MLVTEENGQLEADGKGRGYENKFHDSGTSSDLTVLVYSACACVLCFSVSFLSVAFNLTFEWERPPKIAIWPCRLLVCDCSINSPETCWRILRRILQKTHKKLSRNLPQKPPAETSRRKTAENPLARPAILCCTFRSSEALW
jgi:hypothetical protein